MQNRTSLAIVLLHFFRVQSVRYAFFFSFILCLVCNFAPLVYFTFVYIAYNFHNFVTMHCMCDDCSHSSWRKHTNCIVVPRPMKNATMSNSYAFFDEMVQWNWFYFLIKYGIASLWQ